MEYIELILTGLIMLVIALQVEAIRMFRNLDTRIRELEIKIALYDQHHKQRSQS